MNHFTSQTASLTSARNDRSGLKIAEIARGYRAELERRTRAIHA
jgi:hypothetical protein